ncbi:MAG: aminotransferase class I/II-fold pyridoxal phosphate-dependent enzyme [Parcubacteria group bacterium]|jgi:7-keto-8-aminopelargonate synthetase-like enzyme
MGRKTFFDMCPGFAATLRGMGLYGDSLVIEGTSLGAKLKIAGIKDPVTSWISLDYLGLGDYEPIRENAIGHVKKYGTGFASSRVIMDTSIHQELEACLADFKGVPRGCCLLVNTGYAANSMLISMLVADMRVANKRIKDKPRTLIFKDALTHASIIEATLYQENNGKNETINFPHLDYDMLEQKLEEYKHIDADKYIVTDSLFSMNGSFADIRRIYELAEQFSAFIVLDNAHSDGTYGEEGRGLLYLNDGVKSLPKDIFLETGTLSKSVCCIGGYMTLTKDLCELARVSQWPYIFSVGLPTFLVATICDTISIIRGPEGDRRRKNLHQNSIRLLKLLKENGFNTLNSESHIIPIVIGKETKCLEVQEYLLNKFNMMVGAVRFPAVKRGEAILRIPITASHVEDDIASLHKALVMAKDKFNF